jgi:carbon monoxide dehydrogenase subunit G
LELSNEHRIPAPRSKVWSALNDPRVLRQSIPGCEELEQADARTLRARVRSKVGPIAVRFNGVVELSEIDVDHGYKISFRGEGGAAGFVKGNAVVSLDGGEDDTVLRYTATAQIGGRLAQIGSRLIDGVAAKTAAEFFDRFTAYVTGSPAAEVSVPEGKAVLAERDPATSGSAALRLSLALSDTQKIGLALVIGTALGWLVGRRRE